LLTTPRDAFNQLPHDYDASNRDTHWHQERTRPQPSATLLKRG
jgi:hypothetical protein